MAGSITPLIQEYTVDFASNNNFVFIKAVQGDGHTTRYADIILMNNGQPYKVDAEAVQVVIRGTKPDGNEIFNTCEIQGENTIRAEISQQITAVPGKVNCEISIMDRTENRTLTSFPFYIVVEKNAVDVSSIVSSDEFTMLIEKINEADNSIKDANTATDNLNALNEKVTEQENARVEAENKRVETEEARVEAENNRVIAEEGRVETERERVEAEAGRVNAENVRVESENTRIQSENDRVTAENTREENETERKETEASRVEAETARAKAEEARKSAEDARVEAENSRVEAEKARDTAEQTRISNENQRIENENTRQSQETTRQQNTATAISDAEEATAAAWNAIEQIQTSIGINDNEESYASVWSSKHTMDVIKERYYRKSIKDVTIPRDGWENNFYYIKNDRITPDSVVDIYYNEGSFDEVNRAYLHYILGEGYLQFKALIAPMENIVIDDILIENYTEQEEYTAGGTV